MVRGGVDGVQDRCEVWGPLRWEWGSAPQTRDEGFSPGAVQRETWRRRQRADGAFRLGRRHGAPAVDTPAARRPRWSGVGDGPLDWWAGTPHGGPCWEVQSRHQVLSAWRPLQAEEERDDMERVKLDNRRILFNLLPAHVAQHFLMSNPRHMVSPARPLRDAGTRQAGWGPRQVPARGPPRGPPTTCLLRVSLSSGSPPPPQSGEGLAVRTPETGRRL